MVLIIPAKERLEQLFVFEEVLEYPELAYFEYVYLLSSLSYVELAKHYLALSTILISYIDLFFSQPVKPVDDYCVSIKRSLFGGERSDG